MQANFQSAHLLTAIQRLLIGSGTLIVVIGNFTSIDLAIADGMFDAASGQFRWHSAWPSDASAIRILQNLSTFFAVALITLAIWDTAWPRAWLRAHRAPLRVVAAAAALIPTAIHFFSIWSGAICPSDLQRYGGVEAYTQLLETAPSRIASTACVPASGSGNVWWLLALAAFWIPTRPKMAVVITGLMVLAGLALSTLLQLQGTQFFTQTLWAAWIASYLVFALYHVFIADDGEEQH